MKISIVAVLAAVLCVLLRQNERALTLVLSVLTCVIILVLGFRFLCPIWTVIQKMESLSGLGADVTKPLLKVVGIGLMTQITGSICADAGEASLSKAVETGGTILSVYASLPLLNGILTLVEELLGGGL